MTVLVANIKLALGLRVLSSSVASLSVLLSPALRVPISHVPSKSPFPFGFIEECDVPAAPGPPKLPILAWFCRRTFARTPMASAFPVFLASKSIDVLTDNA